MKLKAYHLSFAILTLFVFQNAIIGQSLRGRIGGVVKDAQDKPIPNASLTITNTETGEKLQTTTDEDGSFLVLEVKPGTYQISASTTGFKKATISGILVQVATVSTVNIQMEAGGVNEEVTVTAADSQETINSTSPEVGEVVDRQKILELPLDGRNPLELTALQAGVQTKTGADGEVASFSVNGNRTVANNITVDGVNASDNFLKTPSNITLPVIPVSVESIGEFRVTTTLASAEFGRGTSQINAITASGTNKFRGSIFEFHRNTAFNANTFFNNATIDPTTGKSLAREPLIRNQFGGRLGGPIAKDKSFFFFSYEAKRESRGLSRNRLVYTPQARAGIFRYLKGLPNTPANVANSIGTAPATGANSCAVATVLNGTICVQNVLGINALRTTIDPTLAAYLGITPTPNNFQIGDGLNTGGYRFNAKILSPSDQFAGRIDYKINEKNSIEAVFSYGDINFNGDFINEGEQAFPDSNFRTRNTIGRGLSTTLRSTLSSSMLNEFRFGAQLSSLAFGNSSKTLGSAGYVLDIATVNEPLENFAGSGRSLRVLQFTDNFTKIQGNHVFKLGWEVRLPWVRRWTYSGTIPVVDFSTSNDPGFVQATNFPGSQVNEFTLSRVLANTITGAAFNVAQQFNIITREGGFVRGAPEVRTYSNVESDIYVQDSWRIRPSLSLSLGMRYEYSSTPRELNRLALLPVGGSAGLYGVSGNGNLFKPGILTGSRPVLDIAYNGLYKADKNNIAPVLGFAWDPFGKGKTSVRGGYRMSFVRGSFNNIDGTLDDNEGLIITTQTSSSFFLRNGVPLPPVPAVSLPAVQSIQTNSLTDIRAFDENLRSPTVHELTLGVQREILKNVSLEIRYVGNRGKDLYRGYDLNQVNVFARDSITGMTFIDAFRIAQNNLRAARAVSPTATSFQFNAAIPGSMANPLMDALFTGQTSSYTLTNFVQRLEEGRAGDFIDYLLRIRALGGIRGGSFLSAVNAGRLPLNFLRANPDVRGAQLFTNGSKSAYDSLQIEVVRRLTGGVRFQANYTFGKGLSDFVGSSGDTSSFLDLTNPGREYSQFTNTHQVSGNVLYQLPFGRNRKFLRSTKGVLGHLISGWQIGSIVKYSSGDPLNILSGRGTLNSDTRSASNTVDVVGNLTSQQLQALTGIQKNPNGVFFINPNLAPASTSNSSEVIFLNPQAGTVGSLGLSSIYGPRFFNIDFSTLKRTRINERFNVEFRGEIFNLLNNVNYDNPETNINSSNFGRITGIVGRPRLLQFSLRLNF